MTSVSAACGARNVVTGFCRETAVPDRCLSVQDGDTALIRNVRSYPTHQHNVTSQKTWNRHGILQSVLHQFTYFLRPSCFLFIRLLSDSLSHSDDNTRIRPYTSIYTYCNPLSTLVTICTASLTSHNSTFCPHSAFMCFVWISGQTAIISLHNINWLVCITQTGCVYCAVRTGCLSIIKVTFCL